MNNTNTPGYFLKKKYLFLDLDGTVIDPVVGITTCVAYALNYFGIQVNDLNELSPFIGPPLADSFMDYYNFSKEEAEIAVRKYHERFSEKGVYENKLYEGISAFLKAANNKGYKLFLATSKPTVFAEQIINYYQLSGEFVFIGGSGMDGSRKTKADVIRHVLEKNAISDLSEVVMIGDRKHDILGAKETGIDSIGVLYGYGDLEELEKAGADYIVDSIGELARLFYLEDFGLYNSMERTEICSKET
ncbi:MAG: HAD-IA family hydrolase [Candidatus Azobacteroides sp.]|nr:HAD-IA family hydrolase [Candidatus Azobacteroides sp.]